MLGLDEMLQDPEFLAEMRRELLQEAETATFEATAQVRDGTRVDFMNGLLGSRVYGGSTNSWESLAGCFDTSRHIAVFITVVRVSNRTAGHAGLVGGRTSLVPN